MEERIYLEKPNLIGIDNSLVIEKYFKNVNECDKYLYRVNDEEYLYWKDFKQKAKPEDFSSEQFWFLAKLLRRIGSRQVAVRAETGEHFNWYRMKTTDERLHNIDMYLGGQLMAFQSSIDEDNRQRFMARGILEESIASSQLEGASTSRRAAKQMIAEKRAPRNESEQMIYNNYQTLNSLESKYIGQELTLEMLYELHASLTEKTVDPSEMHRLRKDDDEIAVYYNEKIAHIPPKQDFVSKEILRLIDFANDKSDEGFMHPVNKAVFLHFWVGYLHPFTDGNGRLARTLFYWYLLKKSYWVLMYLPISSVIKQAPGQYAFAYIHSEQDELDITYFYDFHLHKILQSISGLKQYIARIDAENRQLDTMLGKELILNDRQKRLLHHVMADNGSEYTSIMAHSTLNSVSRVTAYSDIKPLLSNDLLIPRKVGRGVRFYPSDKLVRLSTIKPAIS